MQYPQHEEQYQPLRRVLDENVPVPHARREHYVERFVTCADVRSSMNPSIIFVFRCGAKMEKGVDGRMARDLCYAVQVRRRSGLGREWARGEGERGGGGGGEGGTPSLAGWVGHVIPCTLIDRLMH